MKLLDRLREFVATSSEANCLDPDQHLLETMKSRIEWQREELERQAKLPILDFRTHMRDLQDQGLIHVRQKGHPRHYPVLYSLTNDGLRRARHNLPRSH